jgi:hypothetical protein
MKMVLTAIMRLVIVIGQIKGFHSHGSLQNQNQLPVGKEVGFRFADLIKGFVS